MEYLDPMLAEGRCFFCEGSYPLHRKTCETCGKATMPSAIQGYRRIEWTRFEFHSREFVMRGIDSLHRAFCILSTQNHVAIRVKIEALRIILVRYDDSEIVFSYDYIQESGHLKWKLSNYGKWDLVCGLLDRVLGTRIFNGANDTPHPGHYIRPNPDIETPLSAPNHQGLPSSAVPLSLAQSRLHDPSIQTSESETSGLLPPGAHRQHLVYIVQRSDLSFNFDPKHSIPAHEIRALNVDGFFHLIVRESNMSLDTLDCLTFTVLFAPRCITVVQKGDEAAWMEMKKLAGKMFNLHRSKPGNDGMVDFEVLVEIGDQKTVGIMQDTEGSEEDLYSA